MSIAAGTLRHRIMLQHQVTSFNSFGEQSKNWETFATVWAAIYPLSAREFQQADATQSEIVGRITIRYRADIDNSVRILHGSNIYNVAGVLTDPDSGREYLTLPVSKGLDEG